MEDPITTNVLTGKNVSLYEAELTALGSEKIYPDI
jgi:hypothetical protein